MKGLIYAVQRTKTGGFKQVDISDVAEMIIKAYDDLKATRDDLADAEIDLVDAENALEEKQNNVYIDGFPDQDGTNWNKNAETRRGWLAKMTTEERRAVYEEKRGKILALQDYKDAKRHVQMVHLLAGLVDNANE